MYTIKANELTRSTSQSQNLVGVTVKVVTTVETIQKIIFYHQKNV
jgi:hypothetical protein